MIYLIDVVLVVIRAIDLKAIGIRRLMLLALVICLSGCDRPSERICRPVDFEGIEKVPTPVGVVQGWDLMMAMENPSQQGVSYKNAKECFNGKFSLIVPDGAHDNFLLLGRQEILAAETASGLYLYLGALSTSTDGIMLGFDYNVALRREASEFHGHVVEYQDHTRDTHVSDYGLNGTDFVRQGERRFVYMNNREICLLDRGCAFCENDVSPIRLDPTKGVIMDPDDGAKELCKGRLDKMRSDVLSFYRDAD